MDDLCKNPSGPVLIPEAVPEPSTGQRAAKVKSGVNGYHSKGLRSAPVPTPPFLGNRIVTDIDMRVVFPFLNEPTLISTQSQFRKNNVDRPQREQQIRQH